MGGAIAAKHAPKPHSGSVWIPAKYWKLLYKWLAGEYNPDSGTNYK
jgi:hypothetical protein